MLKMFTQRGGVLLLLLLFVNTLCFSQAKVFTENFETATSPDSVTTIGTATWAKSSTLYFDGSYSDSCALTTGDSAVLTTDAFSTTGSSFVKMKFRHICKIEYFDEAFVEVSADNGLTWTRLTNSHYEGGSTNFDNSEKFSASSYTDWQFLVAAIPDNTWWKEEQFDISSIASNASQVKIRFRLKDKNSNASADNYAWFIDGIEVFAANGELDPPSISLINPMVNDTVYHLGPFNVHADITDASGIDTAYIEYQVNSLATQTVGMNHISGDQYMGKITSSTGFIVTDTVRYRIIARDNSSSLNQTTEPTVGMTQFIIFPAQNPPGCTTPISVFPYIEDFESGFSASANTIDTDWDRSDATFKWAVESYDVSGHSTETGPEMDHTTGTDLGTYIYTEASSGSSGNTAWITTPCIDITSLTNPRLQFFYHMYGSTMGQLQVKAFYGNDWVDIMTPIVGQQQTSATEAWREVSIDLTPYKGVTKIRFEGTRGTNYYSDIAIDDIKIFEPLNDDAGIQTFQKPIDLTYSGAQDVKVKLTNYGANDLSAVTINWEVDGVAQTPFSWTGHLGNMQSQDSVVIGSYAYPNTGDIVLKAWTSNPNGSTDPIDLNDTATTTTYVCASSLNGAYTLGGSGANFNDFAELIYSLETCGVTGPVTINVNPGTYNEQIIFKNPIVGGSATNTVTIQSSTGDTADVIIWDTLSSYNEHVIHIDGISNIAFKHLSIKGVDDGSARVIDIQNDASHITFEGNHIWMEVSTSSSDRLFYSDDDAKNITLHNNTFEGAYYGIYMYASSSSRCENITITNNKVLNVGRYGISVKYADTLTIEGNHVESNSLSYGIESYSNQGPILIKGNKVYSSYSSTMKGIHLYRNTGTSTNPMVVANNFVYIEGSSSANIGIDEYGNSFADIVFNTVNIHQGGSTSSAFMSSTSTYASDIRILNNTFYNYTSGYAMVIDDTNKITLCDFNNVYSPNGDLTEIENNDYSTFTDLQSNWSANANSLSINPVLIGNDYHMMMVTLNDKGTPFAGITTDIDGEARDANTPDIGCDEFELPPIDAGIQSFVTPTVQDSQNVVRPITVKLRNYGTDALTAVTIEYIINGGTPVSHNWTGNLAASTSTDVTLPSYTVPGGDFTLEAYTVLASDLNTQNDTASATIFGWPEQGIEVYSLVSPSAACGLGLEDVEVKIKNVGYDTIKGGVSIALNFNNAGYGATETIAADILPGAYYTHTFSNQVDLSIVDQDSTFKFEIVASVANDPVNTDDTLKTTVKSKYVPNDPVVANTTVYHGASITLNASSNAPIKWYSTATSYSSLASGDAYTTPVLTDTTSYFVEAKSSSYCKSNRVEVKVFVLDPPAIDAKLQDIIVADGCGLDQEDVEIEIYNYGTDTIKGGMTVKYQIDNGAWTNTEAINDHIAPGKFVSFVMNQKALLDAPNQDTTYDITAIVMHTNDPNQFNDTLVLTGIESKFTPAIPTLSDIDVVYYTTGTFTSTFSGDVNWYDQANAVVGLSQGASFTTPTLFDTTSFWVEYENTANGCRSDRQEVKANVTSIPAIDLSLAEIITNTGCQLSGTEQVSIKVANNGTQSTSATINASFRVANGSFITPESITQSIASQDTITYTFTTTANLYYGVDSTIEFKAYIENANDNYADNDTNTTSIQSMFTPIAPTASDVTVQFGDQATLTATSSHAINWYEDQTTAQALVSNSATYTTPPVYAAEDYYVTSQYLGATNHEIVYGGTTGSGSYGPNCSSNGYGWAQTIYPKSEMNGAMLIDSIGFYITNAANFTQYDQKIYIALINDSIAPNDNQPDPSTQGYTLVYDDSIAWNATGWVSIALETPFYYDGSNHLCIYWENRHGSNVSYSDPYPRFRYKYFSSYYGDHNRTQYSSSNYSFPTSSYTSNSANGIDIKFIGSIPMCESDRVQVNVDHFPLPPADLNVVAIDVNNGCGLGNESVTISYVNQGTDSLKADYTAKFQVDGHPFTAIETIQDTSVFGDTLSFTFNALANLSTSTDTMYTITVVMNHPNDPNSNNDTLVLDSIYSYYTPAAPIVSTPISVAYGQSTLVSVSATDSVYWFIDDQIASSFHKGMNYQTPILYDTVSYWVAAKAGKGTLAITEITQYPTGTGQAATFPSYLSGTNWDGIEISNLGMSAVDLGGYTLHMEGSVTGSYTFPQGSMLESGLTALAMYGSDAIDDASNMAFNMGISSNPMSGDDVGYYLTDPAGDVIDAVATNSYTFPTSSIVTGTDWSGNIASSSGNAGVSRIAFDNNDASDWIVSDASNLQSVGIFNSALSLLNDGICASQRVEIKVETTTQPDDDASLNSFVTLAQSCPGLFDLEAKVKNYGADTLEQVDIVYSLNGAPAVSHTETGLEVLSGDTTAAITFANINLNSGYHSLKLWTANPNGNADLSNFNDTLEVKVMIGLNGVLSLGSPTSDFATFDDLFVVMDSLGLCGPTTINIEDGIYNLHYSIGEIKGASATNTLTLQSASADSSLVTLQYAATSSADNYILELDGTDHVTLQSLGFEATGTGNYGRLLLLNSQADSNTIKNCSFTSLVNTSTYSAGIYSTSQKDAHTSIANNYFKNGYYAIYVKGSSSTNLEQNLIIENNIIEDFYSYGIYAYYQDTCSIKNNTISKMNTTGSSTQYGIYLAYSDNYNSVEGNKIYLNPASGTTLNGINVYYCDGAANSMINLTNNMVSMDSQMKGYGVYVYNSSYVNIYSNTVASYSNSASSAAFYNNGSYTSNGTKQYIKNNIFAHFGNGYAMYAGDATAIESSDYNNLYSTGTKFVNWAGDHADLASLRITSNMDHNSVNVEPYFYAPNDLHTVEIGLNNLGTPLAVVTTDIDGELRHASTPDIGADEFTPSAIDAGAVALAAPYTGGCFSNAEIVSITVRNHGSDTIKFVNNNLSIDVTVSGVVSHTFPTHVINTGKLAPGATLDVVISNSFDMSSDGDYTFEATASANGETNMANNAMMALTINASPIIDVYPHEEDFESYTVGVGGISNGWYTEDNSFKWTVEDGATPATYSGPDAGHDAASTRYLYTEASNGLTGDTARLYSTCLDFTSLSNIAMQFYYHKYGSSMGDLYVEVRNSSFEWVGVDTISGQTHSTASEPWIKRTIDLSSYTGNITRVRFTAVRGSGSNGDMAIDDIKFFEPQATDASIAEVTQPSMSFAPAGAATPLEVVIENFGYTTLTSIPVKVVYNGSTVLNETWTGSLAPFDTTLFTFTSPLTIAAGVHDVKVYCDLTGDANHTNDTTVKVFQGLQTFTPNYHNDFEGTQHFVTTPGSEWELGTPNNTNINAANSPSKAWVTNLDGDYSNNANSYLYTPFFDLSSLGSSDTVSLSFFHYMDTEVNEDFGKLQYSLDDGNTWIFLGSQNDPMGTNWYNENDGGNHMFSHDNSGWMESSYKLDPTIFNFAGRVQFRFLFASDGSVTNEGWAIDDFKLTLPIVPNNAGMASINNIPSTVPSGDVVTVDVDIVNDGNNVLTSIPVKYKVTGQSVVSETWTGSLTPGSTANYVFTQTFVSPIQDYALSAYTDLSGDPFHSNDTVVMNITAGAAQYDVGVIAYVSLGDTLSLGQSYNVTITIENFGLNAVSSIPVEYTVLANVVQETWTGNLLPGSTVDYTFTQGFTSSAGNYSICAETKLTNDAVSSNNKLCKSLVGTVGINDVTPDNFYLLQNVPNPATEKTDIQFVVPNADEVQFELVDMLGQTLHRESINAQSGHNKLTLDVSNYDAGLYHYVVIYKGYRLTKTMVITR